MKITDSKIVYIFCLLALAGCKPDPQKAKVAFVESGNRYVSQTKYPEAIIQYRNALKIDPRYAEAYYQLGKVELAVKRWREAYAALVQAADLAPERSDIHLSLAEMYLAGNDFKKGQETASKILATEPANRKALQFLGAALMGQQDYAGAEAVFTKLTQIAPDPSAFTSLSLVELKERKLDSAEQHLTRAIDLDPHFAVSYENLATLYRIQKKYDKTEAVLRRGVQNNPQAISLYISLLEVLRLEARQDQVQAVLQQLHARADSTAAISSAIGDWYSSNFDFSHAALEYQRGLVFDTKNTDLKLKLIETYLNSLKVNEAAALNDRLLVEEPNNLIARVNKGRILAAQGKLDEAVTQLLGQIKDTPDSPEVHYYLALVYSAKNDVEQAKRELSTTLKLAPNSPLAARALAQIYYGEGDFSLAQETLQGNLTGGSPDLVDIVLMGDILLRAGDTARARAQFEWARVIAPDNPAVSLNLAAVDEAEKKWGDAEKNFQNAVRLNGKDAATLSAYSEYLLRRNQPEKAVQLLRQFVESAPKQATAHLALGAAYVDIKSYADGANELQLALQLDPKLVQGYVLMAKMQRDQGNLDGAIENCRRAVALQPNSSPLLTLAGNLYLMKGDYVSAQKYFEQALVQDPDAAVAASNLAWIATHENGNLDVALSLAQKAKRLAPQVDSITDTLGWVEYKKGSYSSSIPLFQESVQGSPNVPAYHFHLGMALIATGESAKARDQLQAALRLKLAGEEAEQARQALDRLK